MKTTTRVIAIKKLENLDYAKSRKCYQIVKELLGGGNKTYAIHGNTIRPCYTSGSGRFTSNQDHTSSLVTLLNKLGIEYVLSNDATRGSVTGNLITITTKFK